MGLRACGRFIYQKTKVERISFFHENAWTNKGEKDIINDYYKKEEKSKWCTKLEVLYGI